MEYLNQLFLYEIVGNTVIWYLPIFNQCRQSQQLKQMSVVDKANVLIQITRIFKNKTIFCKWLDHLTSCSRFARSVVKGGKSVWIILICQQIPWINPCSQLSLVSQLLLSSLFLVRCGQMWTAEGAVILLHSIQHTASNPNNFSLDFFNNYRKLSNTAVIHYNFFIRLCFVV